MKTSVALLLAGCWVQSAVAAPDREVCERLLAESPMFQFERTYPENPRAPRDSARDVYWKFIALFLEHSDHPFGLRSEVPVGTPMSDVLERILQERNEIADALDSLGGVADKELRDVEKKIAALVRGGNTREDPRPRVDKAKALESLTFLFPAAAKMFRRGYSSRPFLSETVRSAVYQDPQTSRAVLGPIAGSIPHLFRELRVSFCVPKVEGRYLPIRALAKDKFLALDKAAIRNLSEPELSFPIDLVFRDDALGGRWGVVAPYDSVFSGTPHLPDLFQDRIREMVGLKQRVARTAQVHVFFVNGITAEAKKSVESLGVVVVGPVVKPSPPGTEAAFTANGSE